MPNVPQDMKRIDEMMTNVNDYISIKEINTYILKKNGLQIQRIC